MPTGLPEKKKRPSARSRAVTIQLDALEPRILLSSVSAPDPGCWEPELLAVLGPEGPVEVPVHPERIVVGFDSTTVASAEQLLELIPGAELLHEYAFLDAAVIGLPDGVSVAEALELVSPWAGLAYAEPDYVYTWDQLYPNDPDFGLLWGLHNTGQTGGTADADIDAPEAWEITTGSSTVVVGVIDTGIDYTHVDLVDNIWTNPGEIPGNAIDDDGNGYIDDYYGYHFYLGSGDPIDIDGHGTHVAGTIGAVGDNGIGVVGVNWDVSLAALAVGVPGTPFIDMAAAIEAIGYAVMMGFDVTNNSWGGYVYSQTVYDAIAVAGANDQLFVAAAGNDWNDNDVMPSYPASYDLANIISVAATNDDDELVDEPGWWGSNYGATSVDLAAPGLDIYSTVPGDSYDWYSGTSMAAPHVTGAVALLIAEDPVATAAQIKALILDYVDVVPGLAGLMVTGGRLNLFNAVEASPEPPPEPFIDLVAQSLAFLPDYLYGVSDAAIQYTLQNVGNTDSGAFVLEFYLSEDHVLDVLADSLLGSENMPGGLASLASYSGSINLTDFPSADPFGSGGRHYVYFTVDQDNVIEESDEDNNVLDIPVPWYRGPAFYDDFSTDTGWTTDLLGRWERAPAEGGGGQYGNADPAFDATATGDQYLLGYNIGSDYQNAITNTIWVTSPVIDCTDFTGLSLRFERWLNVDSPYLPYFDDHVYIEAYDGADWQLVFENTDRITDSAWQTLEYDVSIHADGNSSFRIRFGMGPTNVWQRYSGWNIDDVRIIGAMGQDTISPQVEAVILPAETSVPITSMEVDFSEGMALYPLTDLANYSLFDETLVMPVPISTVDSGLDYAELALGTPLQIGNTYRLTVLSGGLVDYAGNALDGDPGVMGLEDFEHLFTLPGLYVVEPIDAYGGRVTFYDTDLTVPDDVRPAAIIRGNDVVGITQVILLSQYAQFGVVIEQRDGSSQPIAIYDVTSDPYGISYIVADANVSLLSLTSELLGMNLNGATLGANVNLPLDIDGDSLTDDAVSFVGLGNVGVVVSGLPITGDVVVTGNVNYVGLHGVNASVTGEVTVGGNLGQFRMASGDFDGSLTVGGSLGLLYLGSTTDLTGTLTAGDVGVLIFHGPGGVLDDVYSGGDIDLLLSLGPIAADVSATGHVGRVIAMDGTGLGFSLTAGAGLDLLYSLGDVLGDVDVTGNAGVLKVIDGDVDGDLTVSGNLNVVQVIRGSVTDGVNVGGNLNVLYVYNPGMPALADDVTVGGNLGVVRAYGDIDSSIAAGGSGGSVVAFGDVTGAMSFGSGLGLFYASGDFNGDLNVNGNLSRVLVLGSVTDSLVNVTGGYLAQFALLGDLVRTSVNVEGALYSTLVGWNYTDSSINAGRLGRVTVGGTISSTGADYEIHAQMGRFDLFVAGAYYGIDLSHDELFAADRVRAWVGLT